MAKRTPKKVLKKKTPKPRTSKKKQGRGRPPEYAKLNGQTIVGLSGPKAPVDTDGRYYSTHNDPFTGTRVYFGRDLEEAVERFRAWQRQIKRRQRKARK